MAPYNNNNQYRTHYDPVGSQYSQQHHQNYYTPSSQQPQRSTQTPQSQASAPPGYTAAYTTGYSNQPYYSYRSTESRAAETLSHLSAQEHTSNRSSTAQYDTTARNDASSWNTSDRASNQQHDSSPWNNADSTRRTANPSPLHQQSQSHVQRPTSAVSSYSPVQSYAQPQDQAAAYSYNSYTRSEQSKAQTGTAQSNTYDYQASNFRASSPYLARQQQQQQQPQAPRFSISSVASTAPRDHHQTTAASTVTAANVGQPRAPSVTRSSIQRQHASASYSRQSNPPDQNHAPITVDPTQVYDPWPEQQRKLAEARRKAEAEEKRRAEKEAKRKAEEEAKRKAEEEARQKIEEEKRRKAEEEARKKAEEETRRKAEEEARRKAEEDAKRKIEQEKRKAEEQRREEAKKGENLRLAQEIRNQEEAKRRQYQQLQAMQDQQRQSVAQQRQPPPSPSTTAGSAAPAGMAAAGQGLESEMAAIFRRMRDLNSMDPQMFARMWENERQAHLAKAQPVHNQARPAFTPTPAQPRQPPAQPVQNQSRPVFTPTPAQPQRPPAPTSTPAPAQQLIQPPASRALSQFYSQPSASHPATATAGPSNRGAANGPNRVTMANAQASSGGSNAIWPPGKKASLVETATRWLNARKENVNKQVSVDRLVQLLAPNPSYMTLCESLEQIGLFIDRAQFARALLSVVPDAAKTNSNKPASPALPTTKPPAVSSPAPTAQMSQSASSATKGKNWNIGKFPGQRGRPSKAQVAALQNDRNVVDLTTESTPAPPAASAPYQPPSTLDASTVGYQSHLSWAPPADDMPDYGTPTYQQPPQSTAVQNMQKQATRKYSSPYFQQQSNQMSPAAKPTPPPPAPRPPPANKGEAARKRTFAELVDLSAANSESEDDEPPTKQVNTQQYGMTPPLGQPNQALPINLQQYMFNGHGYPTYAVSAVPQPAVVPSTVVNKSAELRGQILVDPIRREKVARKSRYDPRTICRDVLLATGRHPDMRPLNQHLNGMHSFLKNHSQSVELDKFDLETIRWDLIDPGEPIPEPEEPVEDSASTIDEPRENDADDEGGSDIDEEILRLTSGAADPPASDGPFASEHNTPAPAPERRPSTAKVVAVQITTSSQKKASSPIERKVGRPLRQSLPLQASASDGKFSAKQARRLTDVQQRRRATSSNVPDTPRQSTKQSTPNMSTPGGVTGYAAFRSVNPELDADGNPIKKKGRPVGWRKSVHSKAALAAAAGGESMEHATPSSAKASGSRTRNVATPNYAPPKQRRGRPAKAAPEPKEPEVEFNVFKCEWEDCGAELHNIDTLRKHVVKVHGKPTPEGDYECAWLGCFAEDEVTAFEDMGEWMSHMETAHIKPVSRKLGDGPRAGLSDYSEQSDAYLSDRQGRMVTPRISMTLAEKGTKEWAEQQQRAQAAYRLTNLVGSKLEDEKLLQQLEEKKRVVGPVLTRAGAILATDERRRNFLDDEDFFEVIEPLDVPTWEQVKGFE